MADGVPCWLYDASDPDAFGDCCDTLGVTPKPLWFYALISIPIETILVALEQREDGSIGERRTRKETLIFASLTLLALVLIVLRIALPDDDGNRICKDAWECYQAVVFAFTNSSALITCLVLWLRVEFKRHFWRLLAVVRLEDLPLPVVSIAQPIKALLGDYATMPLANLRSRGREGTTKAAEHYFAMFAVLAAGGLTHALPGMAAYSYGFALLLAVLIVNHAARVVGPFRERSVLWTLATPPFVAIALVAHIVLSLLLTCAFVVVGLLTLVLLTVRRCCGPSLAKHAKEMDVRAAAMVMDMSEDREESSAEEDAVIKAEVAKGKKMALVMEEYDDEGSSDDGDLYGRSRSRGRGRARSPARAQPAAAPPPAPKAIRAPTPEEPVEEFDEVPVPTLELSRAGYIGDEKQMAPGAPPPQSQVQVEELREKKRKEKKPLVARLQWVIREIKKVVLFDPMGHVVVWGGAVALASFALGANYALLMYSGAPYVDVPVVDFFARDSERFVTCYGNSFSSFEWETSLLAILELVLFAFGLGGMLIQVGSAVFEF